MRVRFPALGPALLLLALLGLSQASHADYSTERGEWPQYGGNLANSKYSPLDRIDRANVGRLAVAWNWESVDNAVLARLPDLRPDPFKATPLMIDGVLYIRTSLNVVAALDAETGRTLWVYDPKSYEDDRWPRDWGWNTRGLAYWRSGEEERLFLATRDARLIALEPRTGRPVSGFGKSGEVDLTGGFRRPLRRPELISYTSPPVICGDVLVVGSAVLDSLDAFRGEKPPLDFPLGDVRAYDVRTGRQLWTFHTVPQAGELGVDTWGDGSWKWVGATNVWSIMSADEDLGYVYLPVTSPMENFWGGFRPGDNLFGESLVALDARTGRRVWHFQLIHHPLWDYDQAAPPNLVEIAPEGRPLEAVVQLGKTGFAYVFDRRRGKPVCPIDERPVPPSTVPGERAAPTQPFPTRPPPFDRQGVGEEDLIDFTPELREEAKRLVSRYDHGGLFTPPSQRGTIFVPGIGGGATWTGAAFDPESGVLYVTSLTEPTVISLRKAPRQWPLPWARVVHEATLDGLPFLKPPWARITAIDLDRGEIVWQVANGEGPRHHPRLRGLSLPPLGSIGNSSPLVTKTLLFAASTGEGTYTPEGQPGPARLRAFDKKTGEVVWEHVLEPSYRGGAAPMTYLWKGQQYLVIATGGGTLDPARLVAFRLRETAPQAGPSGARPEAGAPGAQSLPSREGARLFARHCAPCHSIGHGRLAGSDLHGIWRVEAERIQAAIQAMKSTQGVQITDAEAGRLVEFLRHPGAGSALERLGSAGPPDP